MTGVQTCALPISLRRALAVWGLTADDIGVLSIHGTSTGANVCEVVFQSVVLLNH